MKEIRLFFKKHTKILRAMNLISFVFTLAHSLKWHPERCSTFANMVVSLIYQGNVQHNALSRTFDSLKGGIKSKLERIRRFFAGQFFDYEAFAKHLVVHVFKDIPKMHLIMDRTNWKFGKTDINYLVLAARVGNITFPVFWSLLEHQGCSDASQRIQLMEMFRRTFGFDKVFSFTADREFIGQDWLLYLCQHKVPFLSASRIIASLTGEKIPKNP